MKGRRRQEGAVGFNIRLGQEPLGPQRIPVLVMISERAKGADFVSPAAWILVWGAQVLSGVPSQALDTVSLGSSSTWCSEPSVSVRLSVTSHRFETPGFFHLPCCRSRRTMMTMHWNRQYHHKLAMT